MSSTDISVTCRVNAHVEDAWRMISTSEGISAWFVDAVVHPGVNGTVTLTFAPGASATVPIRIWDPPRTIEFGTDERSHTFAVHTLDDDVHVTVTDRGVPDAESGVTRDGWQRMLTTFATKLAERT